jgi:lambda repressor-like predicted transcriptional regulator
MDILAIMEQFGIPVAVAMAFGFFIWRQNKFIQSTLMSELDQDFKRLEGIIIKLIDQQKLVQMEQKKLNGIFKAQVEIMARLSGNGLKDKFLRIMEKGGMTDE